MDLVRDGGGQPSGHGQPLGLPQQLERGLPFGDIAQDHDFADDESVGAADGRCRLLNQRDCPIGPRHLQLVRFDG